MSVCVAEAETITEIRRVLLVSHVADSRHPNGGTVYTRSLLHIFDVAFPGVETEVVFFARQHSSWRKRVRQTASLLRSTVSTLPAKVHYFRSGRFAAELALRMKTRCYDLVIFDHAEMLWCLDLVPKETRILAVAHNIEGQVYEQLVGGRASSALFGWFFRRDIRRFQHFELGGVARARQAIAISTVDAETLRAQVPKLEVLVVPPTFSYAPEESVATPGKALRIGLLGNFGWWPNRDAYAWFRERVWPAVRGEPELHVFGNDSERLPEAPRTHRHGFVAALGDVWNSVDLMVNPIVSGSGVNIKVAEAIYNGMPMLCTTRAVAGMGLDADPAIVILDDAGDWVRFLSGDRAWALAGRQPRNATRRNFHADGQVPRLRGFLDARNGPSEARPQPRLDALPVSRRVTQA